MGRAAVASQREKKTEDSAGAGDEPWKVVLFNCDCHTFDEVENVVMKATRCTLSRARRISNEVHSRGSAVVYDGPLERCEAVADVIGAVGLRVKVVE
ncbi:MAG TPA: ATP-dependent Clp protease adaptor ClpS [Elusimicrobiota bacterium]|nr:ATP-dependent Clp protease adaptor ClpS [Elusimicrobiota bacterium]